MKYRVDWKLSGSSEVEADNALDAALAVSDCAYVEQGQTFERGIRLTSNDFVYQVRQRWINVRDFDRFKRTIVDDLFAKGFLSALANSDAMKRDRRN